jgi:predicted house-cleaning noncanonical NTP pyrophosphatase (MazG superfamily)
LQELFKKLEEEAGEMIEARADKQELIKEIGDVYEIIDAIIDNCGLDKAEIMKLKNERKIERGGFDKKIFLESIDN